jgi:hypothetical protein
VTLRGNTSKADYSSILQNLLGLKLTMATHAASLRGFIFEPSPETPDSKPWVVHIQCSWRIEAGDRIVTGSGDWSEPADLEGTSDDWDPAEGGSLQEARLREFLDDQDLLKRTVTNKTALLICTEFEVQPYGGLTIRLTGGYALQLFPAASRGEYWRVFQKGDTSSHVICEA